MRSDRQVAHTIDVPTTQIIDDIIELDWMAKLGGQVLIAGGMAFGDVQLASFPIFGLTLGSSRLWLFVSVFFIVGIMNAVNFIDGLDGLASGMIAIGAGSFFVYSYIVTRLMGAGLLRDDRQPHRDRAARGCVPASSGSTSTPPRS